MPPGNPEDTRQRKQVMENTRCLGARFLYPHAAFCFIFSVAVKNTEEACPTDYLISTLATIFSFGHFVKVARTQVYGSGEVQQEGKLYTMDSVIKLFTSTSSC